jgi:acetyl esterase/lipase
VRAAVAFYPPVDLQAYVAYRGYRSFALGPVAIPGRREVLAHLLGGRAEDIPERYALFSPLSHAGEGCPPTLLLVPGSDDIVPMEPVRELQRRLVAAGVPAYLAEFPGCEHGFDLALPRYSPAVQAAVADVRRFLRMIITSH